jgi:hypothetical protein
MLAASVIDLTQEGSATAQTNDQITISVHHRPD